MTGNQQRTNGRGEQIEEANVSSAKTAHVFSSQGKARIAYFDADENFIGYQDVTGLAKVELPVDL